jgi:hypothetical protein
MISADKYPAFSRNFEDEEDYLAAKSAVHSRFDAALGLSQVPQIRYEHTLVNNVRWLTLCSYCHQLSDKSIYR